MKLTPIAGPAHPNPATAQFDGQTTDAKPREERMRRAICYSAIQSRALGPGRASRFQQARDEGEEQRSMQPTFLIRPETDADTDAITAVTVAAFATLEVSNQTEHFIIEALRAADALSVSLVAESGGRVVGHVAFSPIAVSDGTPNWYGLGPVAVLPEYQRMGIGKALIGEGLARLKDLGAGGCCLVGHPEYYRMLGFRPMPGLVLAGVPPEVFLALSFDGYTPQGSVCFHEAFKADGPRATSA